MLTSAPSWSWLAYKLLTKTDNFMFLFMTERISSDVTPGSNST